MLGSLRWTDKQREIAQLVADGKEFKDITAFGYSNYMVTKVKLKALPICAMRVIARECAL